MGPAQTAKKQTRPRPFRACVFFLLFGRVACFFAGCSGGVFCFFWLFGRGLFFCCLGRVDMVFLAVWAAGVLFFCCWGGWLFLFLLSGRGTGVHSLTGLPGSSLRDPATKKAKHQKKKHGFPRKLVHLF